MSKRGMMVLISILFHTICTGTPSVMPGGIGTRGTTARSIRCGRWGRCVSIAGINVMYARVWGRPRATKHTKNASYRGGRAAD